MYWDSSAKLAWVAKRLTQALEHAGIRVLQNESVALPLPSHSGAQEDTAAASDRALYLAGVAPEYGGEADVDKALAGIPGGAPRIVLMHNPRSFKRLAPGSAPLALAAHTHGGQIRIPGLPAWSWLKLVAEGDNHTDGWIADAEGAPGNRLYVNRGIGFSVLPMRINCPPEVTYIRLLPAAAGTH